MCFQEEVGPGVWDIHSPRIPSVGEMTLLLRKAPPENIWENPDCGLKTHGWAEVKTSLENMVGAAKELRQQSSYSASSKANNASSCSPRGASMRALEDDFGDARLLGTPTGIEIIDGEFDHISLIQVDVTEMKVLPSPCVGKAQAGNRFPVHQQDHRLHTGIPSELLKRANHPIGNGDSVKGRVAAFRGEFFWNAKLDFLTGPRRGGNPCRHGIVVAEFRGRLQRGGWTSRPGASQKKAHRSEHPPMSSCRTGSPTLERSKGSVSARHNGKLPNATSITIANPRAPFLIYWLFYPAQRLQRP